MGGGGAASLAAPSSSSTSRGRSGGRRLASTRVSKGRPSIGHSSPFPPQSSPLRALWRRLDLLLLLLLLRWWRRRRWAPHVGASAPAHRDSRPAPAAAAPPGATRTRWCLHRSARLRRASTVSTLRFAVKARRVFNAPGSAAAAKPARRCSRSFRTRSHRCVGAAAAAALAAVQAAVQAAALGRPPSRNAANLPRRTSACTEEEAAARTGRQVAASVAAATPTNTSALASSSASAAACQTLHSVRQTLAASACAWATSRRSHSFSARRSRRQRGFGGRGGFGGERAASARWRGPSPSPRLPSPSSRGSSLSTGGGGGGPRTPCKCVRTDRRPPWRLVAARTRGRRAAGAGRGETRGREE